MERLICLAVGYVFGLFQTGYLYGRFHGIDIRSHGSGNAGTTNMLRTLGTKAGILTFFGDGFKCAFAVWTVQLLFRKSCGDILPLLSLYAGAGAVLGHNYPFYLGFRGGKGIAATGGLLLALNPVMTLLGIVTFAAAFLLTHYVSLGSLLVYTGFLAEIILFGQRGVWGMTQPRLYEMYALAAALTILAFWKHHENISRLLHGCERKTYLFRENKKD